MAETSLFATEGQRLLRAFLREHAQADLARVLGIRQQSVSEWKRGKTRPTVVFRTLLAHVIGIPADTWLTRAERKQLHTTRISRAEVPRKRRTRSVHITRKAVAS